MIPFAGFWSKDEIIVGAWVTDQIPITIGQILAIVGLVTAFFTAFYMFRLVFLVFTGEPRFDPHEIHPHESPPSMTIPLVLLAIPSVAHRLVDRLAAGRGVHPHLPGAGLPRCGRHGRGGRGRLALHAAGGDSPGR